MLAPQAVGEWRSLGGYEPDTYYDLTGGRMWETPNESPDPKVYFNVVATNTDASTNPNVALLGSRITPPGERGFEAFYGVWVDCNRDGYIGNIETVQFEYRDEQLLDKSLCPPGSRHNVRDINVVSTGWVSELIWISPPGGADGNGDGTPDGRDGRSYHDLGARVWGDIGLPGDRQGGEICARLEPVNNDQGPPGSPVWVNGPSDGAPRGTYQETGHFLNYWDCYTGHRGFDTAQTVLPLVGLGFDEEHAKNKDWSQEGHPLNFGTFGDHDYNDTYVRVYDCDGAAERVHVGPRNAGTDEAALPLGYTSPFVEVTDENGEAGVYVIWNRDEVYGPDEERSYVFRENLTYREPSPGNFDAENGHLAGTYAHVTRGASEGDQAKECSVGEDRGGNFYGFLEGDTAAELEGKKTGVSARFGFYEEQRSGKDKKGNPFEGGVYPVMRGMGWPASGSRWVWSPELGDPPTLPPLVRTSDLTIQGAQYWTFYANLTDATLSRGVILPTSVVGIYGSEWCGNDPTLVVDGFVCDPDKWYHNPDGTPIPNRENWPRPGHAYQLRDIDCWDGTVWKDSPVPLWVGGAYLAPEGGCLTERHEP